MMHFQNEWEPPKSGIALLIGGILGLIACALIELFR